MEMYKVRFVYRDLPSGGLVGYFSDLHRVRSVIRTQREFERLASQLEKVENRFMRTSDRNTRVEVVGIYPMIKEVKGYNGELLHDLLRDNNPIIIDKTNPKWSRR